MFLVPRTLYELLLGLPGGVLPIQGVYPTLCVRNHTGHIFTVTRKEECELKQLMCRDVHLTDTSGQTHPRFFTSARSALLRCRVSADMHCWGVRTLSPRWSWCGGFDPPSRAPLLTPATARARLSGLLPTPHAAGCKLSTPAQARSVGFPRSCPTHHRPPSTMQHVAVIIVHRVAVDWRYRLPVARIFRPAYALPAPPPPTPLAPPTPPTPNQPRSHAKGVSAVQHASAQAAHAPRATHARRLSGRPIYIAKPGYSSV